MSHGRSSLMSSAQVIGVTEGQRKGWTSIFAALKAKGPELCELYRLINLSNPVNPIHKEQEEQIQSKQRKTNTGKQLTAQWQTATWLARSVIRSHKHAQAFRLPSWPSWLSTLSVWQSGGVVAQTVCPKILNYLPSNL